MTTTASTAYSRDLGDELRLLRRQYTRFGGGALADLLGWDPSKVSNIEHGKVRASELDLVQYLTACGRDVDYFEAFLSRYRHAFDAYVVQAPDNPRTIAMAETSATKIMAYDVMAVNILLQTKKYARALLVETGAEGDVDRLVDHRLDRQTVMRRPDPPECLFYLHELALQTGLGDARAREEQYRRLLFDTRLIRIVPAEARSAALLPNCVYLEFDKASPLVFSETGTAKVFAQDTAAVDRATKLFERLDAVALDAKQSRGRLAEYVNEVRRASA